MEINKTLLMGKTGFEMRGNLANKEPAMLKIWNEEHLYQQILKKNEKQPCFMLHDGPPYANGDMHCGHMLNRILKDIIIRFKNMDGYYAPFFPGWDTHGLPIENAVTKKGVNRKTTPIKEFREKCTEFALQQVARQKSQIERLGILADFDKRYLTLDKEFEKSQIEVFASMALQGLIFKGLKPVYWSPSSESALAEAEIEYHDIKAKTIYVRFEVIDGKGLLNKGDYFVIWTTTPWTIPANLAIALNPDLEYGLFKTDKGNFVFLTELEEKMKADLVKEQETFDLAINGGVFAFHALSNKPEITLDMAEMARCIEIFRIDKHIAWNENIDYTFNCVISKDKTLELIPEDSIAFTSTQKVLWEYIKSNAIVQNYATIQFNQLDTTLIVSAKANLRIIQKSTRYRTIIEFNASKDKKTKKWNITNPDELKRKLNNIDGDNAESMYYDIEESLYYNPYLESFEKGKYLIKAVIVENRLEYYVENELQEKASMSFSFEFSCNKKNFMNRIYQVPN